MENLNATPSQADREEFWGGEPAYPAADGAAGFDARARESLRGAFVDVPEAHAGPVEAVNVPALDVSTTPAQDLARAERGSGGEQVRAESARNPLSAAQAASGAGAPTDLREPGAAANVRCDDRDALLIQLVFAARDLAQGCVEQRWNGRKCRWCGAEAYFGASLAHAAHCRAARVLSALDSLQRLTVAAEPREWVIQRCTQKSAWHAERRGAACWELDYEDFPVPEGILTRTEMLSVLERVQCEHPQSEFRGHRLKEGELR